MPDEYVLLVSQLVDLRSSKGLTQRELSDACGLTQSAIARIENKRSIPTITTFQKIVSALDAALIIEPHQTDTSKEA